MKSSVECEPSFTWPGYYISALCSDGRPISGPEYNQKLPMKHHPRPRFVSNPQPQFGCSFWWLTGDHPPFSHNSLDGINGGMVDDLLRVGYRYSEMFHEPTNEDLQRNARKIIN